MHQSENTRSPARERSSEGSMQTRFGIIRKLFLWYAVLIAVFYGTISVYYLNIQKILTLSDDIVNKNYRISSSAKAMIDSLISMEENEKRYSILKNPEYREYFQSSRQEFEDRLAEILQLLTGTKEVVPWEELFRSYAAQRQQMSLTFSAGEIPEDLWIPERMIDGWIQRISTVLATNEREVELAMRDLHEKGNLARRWGMVGVAVSLLCGVLGMMFLARSMSRPLRELRRGIRNLARDGSSEPIRILSEDEFGELAFAFNEMLNRLKEEERMRADFISMLSHEIRNPLTTIRESVSLIEEGTMGTVNDKQRRFLGIARQEAERISGLLKDLLQLSKLEAGHPAVNPRELRPAGLVERCVQRFAPAAEAKSIGIRMDIQPDLPTLIGDPELLEQVLLNLIANAVKFSPPGSEVVVAANCDSGREEVVFAVTDDGPGIPKSEQPFVFQKYYRASSFRHKIDGTGLGLHIAKHIVESHGGTVWLESREGSGSTFGFTLPLSTKECRDEKIEQS